MGLRVTHSGKITLPFSTLDVTVNPFNPAIKITDGIKGQLQLVFQSDHERIKLIEQLMRIKVEDAT